jgi:hypothetical protein
MKPRKPIFYDEQRRRWRRTSRILEICGALFTLLAITFLVNVLVSPRLPEPLLPTNRTALHPVREKTKTKITLKRTGRLRRVESLGQMPATYDPVRAAFYVSWDPTSLAALQQHFRDIDLLIPERLHSVTANGRLDIEPDPKLAAWEQTLQQQTPADQNSHDAALEQFRRHQLAHRRNGHHAEKPVGARKLGKAGCPISHG